MSAKNKETAQPARNFVVSVPKGGVGKSVVSQQALATYNLERYGKSFIRELDDFNHHASWLNNSSIKSEQVRVGDEKRLLSNYFEVLSESKEIDSGITLDVGGNKSCEFFYKMLGAYPELINNIDLFVFPVKDNGISVRTLSAMLDIINKQDIWPLMKHKAVVVINGVRQEVETKEDLLKRYFNVFELLENKSIPYLTLPDMEQIENLESVGATAIEVLSNHSTLSLKARDKMIGMQKRVNSGLSPKSDLNKVAAENLVINMCRSTFGPAIKQFHKQLDIILESADKDEQRLKKEAEELAQANS